MFIHITNCCGQQEPPTPLPVTRPPCGREYMTECGTRLKNTILDQVWGKPLWLRSKIKEIGTLTKAPRGAVEYQKIIQKGDPAGISFNRDKADPAWLWDNTIPIQPYSVCPNPNFFGSCDPDNVDPPEEYKDVPWWPESEALAASETDISVCDNKYYRYLTQYPSIGRPFQQTTSNPKSRGLMISNLIPDKFPGKQVETYNYNGSPQEFGNYTVQQISHDKNEHTNTSYPGKYWISWWNSIHPGNVIGYNGSDIFRDRTKLTAYDFVKCDSIVGGACGKQGCLTESKAADFGVILPQKVTSTYYNSCGLFGSDCRCWGATATPSGITLDIPNNLKFEKFVDIESGWDFTIGIVEGKGLTGWGNGSSGVFNFPDKYKTNTGTIKTLGVGEKYGAILDEDGSLTVWGTETRLKKTLKIAIKDFYYNGNSINPDRLEDLLPRNIVKKGELIPFWGSRSNIYTLVETYENAENEFGVKNDPVSIDMPLDYIWCGRRHILAKTKYPIKINLADLGKQKSIDTPKIRIDPYGFEYNSDTLGEGNIETYYFAWGNGMVGDSYGGEHLRQCAINYLWQYNVDKCVQGMNNIPQHLLTNTAATVIDIIQGTPLTADNMLLKDKKTTKPFFFTSSLADHTVFLRKKWLNICRTNPDDGELRKNGDPAWCEYLRPLATAKCCYAESEPQIDCCCYSSEVGCGEKCNGEFGQPECCKIAEITHTNIFNDSYRLNGGNGPYSCCHPVTIDGLERGAQPSTWECCNQSSGIFIDGWGNDDQGQLTQLGIKETAQYFSGEGYVNKNLILLDEDLIGTDKESTEYIKCTLGPDRTVVTKTIISTDRDVFYGEASAVGQLISKIYGAGENTACLKGILSSNGGNNQHVEYLNAGGIHNNIVQAPGDSQKIDFPYMDEMDKSVKSSFQRLYEDAAATPNIFLKPATNKAENYYQPIFDPNTASKLIFNYTLTIRKYRKTEDDNLELIDSLQVDGDPEKEYTIAGTRGDQRIKPFTGATCDCFWSDYATDMFKIGGHQGAIINNIGYDYSPTMRDNNGEWLQFSQIFGEEYTQGGMEQPWRNFDTAATKPFAKSDGTVNLSFFPGGNKNLWLRNDITPSINYWLAPPNVLTHTLIELPPGKFPSQLSYPCREKYCYGGINNIIKNWCDPCARGFTVLNGIAIWQGRLGCTGCEGAIHPELKTKCDTECGIVDGAFVCSESAPVIRDVYDYKNPLKVFGNVLPDEITITRTDREEDDEIYNIIPALKNKPIYQQEEIVNPITGETTIEFWNVGTVGKIEKRTMFLTPIDQRNQTTKEKPFDPTKPFKFVDILVHISEGVERKTVTFTKYSFKTYDNNPTEYKQILSTYNSFGELNTPIEEAWPSLNRYLIPRWATPKISSGTQITRLGQNTKTISIEIEQTEEIDYPLAVVPAHGGDIGPKYNMEGYFDTELFGVFNYQNSMFWTPYNPAFAYTTNLSNYRPAPKKVYTFHPGHDQAQFHKSRYIKDSIDFEYPFNKHLATADTTGKTKQLQYYTDWRPNKTFYIEFTPPPPGVVFSSRDIASVNKRINGKNKVEPLCGDTETGCSSCSIPFTGAQVAAWGFDLYNTEIVNNISSITGLVGNVIDDEEFGNLYTGQFWLGIAQDRLGSKKRARFMFPVELAPGEVLNFGKGITDKVYITDLIYTNDGIFDMEMRVTLQQPPNDAEGYKNRWGRFNDECSCNSRLQIDEPKTTDVPSPLVEKYRNNPSSLTSEEKASLIVGLDGAQGAAIVQYGNCENTVTYLESGQSPKLSVTGNGKPPMQIGLSDMTDTISIWDKTMNGGGFKGGVAFELGYNIAKTPGLGTIGPELINSRLLYSGNARGAGTIWWTWFRTPTEGFKDPIYDPAGTGVRGFWSDVWSSRGYSNFYTNSPGMDDDKDRVGGDIPFEASHPQGWLGRGFINPTDGYWTTLWGGDSIGDLLPVYYMYGQQPRSRNMNSDNQFHSTSGSLTSSIYLWFGLIYGLDVDKIDNMIHPQIAQRLIDINDPSKGKTYYPRTQNRKRQVLKACCFGDGFMNEPPSALTNSVLPDRYSFVVKRNKYRNLYNAMFHSFPINKGSQTSGVIFRDWHGDPFDSSTFNQRLKTTTPVWADYWYAWEGLYEPCDDGHNWFRSIQDWRHRRWQLPLFIGVNKDNLASIMINNDGVDEQGNQCTPETCPGLELYDTNQTNPFGGVRRGWNHRKYDSITAQVALEGGLVFSPSVTKTRDGTVDGVKCCSCSGYCSLKPYAATFWSLNAPLWYNCYSTFDITFIRPGATTIDPGNSVSVSFTQDYSRWNTYFEELGPGYAVLQTDKIYPAQITNMPWY